MRHKAGEFEININAHKQAANLRKRKVYNQQREGRHHPSLELRQGPVARGTKRIAGG